MPEDPVEPDIQVKPPFDQPGLEAVLKSNIVVETEPEPNSPEPESNSREPGGWDGGNGGGGGRLDGPKQILKPLLWTELSDTKLSDEADTPSGPVLP